MNSEGAPESGSDPRTSIRSRVFVLGAGLMGSGIAAQCALSGHAVTLEDVNEELARRGEANLRRALDSAVHRGKVTPAQRDEAVANVEVAIGLRRVGTAQFVVEAAPEDLSLKRQLFQEVEERASASAILATNTSSLPITSIASPLHDPGRLVGLHFFNPVLQMELVELIPGIHTRPDVLSAAEKFARGLGKTVVHSKDTPGFVTTRGMAVLVNEAAWMLYEGVAAKEDIDVAYRLGFHHPMGPFQLADLVGLDTAVAILDVLWDGFRDSKYRVCPLLRSMVEAKLLGRKTGRGFYEYPAPEAREADVP
jgi:3-hydroxybutyryl-CoA dehydrogenase